MRNALPSLARRAAIALVPLALAACGGGGGGDGPPPPSATCSVTDQKAWLSAYMNDWYFWYRLSPRPDPAPFATVNDYYGALLYTGTDVNFPADRWSYSETTESFNRFYGDGQTLGYGISVAGIEVTGRPDLPLHVRYVEAASDAAAQGVQRGDQVITINGRSAADLIASNDFSVLSPTNENQSITLVLRRDGAHRTVVVRARIFALTPVPALDTLFITSTGRRVGYVVVKDMISQVLTPLEAAFARFRSQGATDLVLDLRYNGGGLVSVANSVASYAAGSRGAGRAFVSLLYNDKRAAANNESFRFANLASALGLARVYVLMGPRTCSASEQVINGLRGVGVDVVAIGDVTCGKPVGFLPQSNCGISYSAVNFESVNDRNEGRYFDGFAPTCPVAEDFTRPLGRADEPLLAAALRFADVGACPVAAAPRKQTQALRNAMRAVREPGERQDMIPR